MNSTSRSLLVLVSYHHNNTQKIAKAFAAFLDAEIRTPQEIGPEELQQYDLIGFGSGILTEMYEKESSCQPTIAQMKLSFAIAGKSTHAHPDQ